MTVVLRRNAGEQVLDNIHTILANTRTQMKHLEQRERELFNSKDTKLVDIHREMEAAYLAIITGLAHVDTTEILNESLAFQIPAMLGNQWSAQLKISDRFFTSVDVDVNDGTGGSTLTYQGGTSRLFNNLNDGLKELDKSATRVEITNSSDSGHNGFFKVDIAKTSGDIVGFTTIMGGIDKVGETALVMTLVELFSS